MIAKLPCIVLFLCFILGAACVDQCFGNGLEDVNQTAVLLVNASQQRRMPDTLFGIFFEVCVSVDLFSSTFTCYFNTELGS